jgi:hypothetical protein
VEPKPSGGSDAPDDALRRLEQRLDRASDAAERLIGEATAAAKSRLPPAGWQVPGTGSGSESGSESRSDLEAISQMIQAVRDLIPPELERRLLSALRELLLAVRAIIDWYLERSEHRRPESGEIQDIPIS